MSDTVKRIHLADGEWWDLETDPTGQELDQMQRLPKKYPEVHETYVAISVVTTAWSFSEPVTPESVASKRMSQLSAVLEVFNRDIVDFLLRSQEQQSSEKPSSSLQPSTNDKSLQSMHLSPSWKQQGGHGPS